MNTRYTIEVNGAAWWLEEAGDGPPVVLVHSGVTDSRARDARFAAFAERHWVVRKRCVGGV